MKVLLCGETLGGRLRFGRAMRRGGLVVQIAPTADQATETLLEHEGPRVAVLMNADALDVCRAVRRAELAFRPHLIVAGSNPSEALEAGADDVVAIDANGKTLFRHLRVARRCVELQTRIANTGDAALSAIDRAGELIIRAAAAPESVATVAWRAIEELRTTSGATVTISRVCLLISEGRRIDLQLTAPKTSADEAVLQLVQLTKRLLDGSGRRSLWPEFEPRTATQSEVHEAGDWRLVTHDTTFVRAKRHLGELATGDFLLEPLVAPNIGVIVPSGVRLTQALITRAKPLLRADTEVDVLLD